MVGPAAKREAVAHLRGVHQMSERRACSLIAADRKMIRYRSRRAPDTELRARLRELANQRRRFGYRRLFILLRDQGEPSGVNRIYRLYREEGLAVRKRRSRRKAVGTRVPILVEAKPNARWSLDFVHDQFVKEFSSLREMATAMLPEFLAHHRDGPICLIGYSFAASLAIELAQQLIGLGKSIPLVVIIDREPPTTSFTPLLRMKHFIRHVGPWTIRVADESRNQHKLSISILHDKIVRRTLVV